MLGDLEEEWHDVASSRGRSAARRWYLRQATAVGLRLAFRRRTRLHPPRTSTPDVLMDALLRDLRLAVRSLHRAPAFTAAAVIALGLGAGAATAVYTLMEGVVLRPLPYDAPEQLVRLYDTQPAEGLDRQPLSPVTFMDYRGLDAFQDAAAWWRPEIVLTDDLGEPVRASTVEVSENFFTLLGVEPVRGRVFPQDETLYDRGFEAVISYDLWQRRFGGSPNVLGTVVRLNDAAYEVVGVAPQGFHFPEDTDVWQRLRWDLAQHSRNARFMGAVARLRPDVSLDAARAEMRSLDTRLEAEYPGTYDAWDIRAEPLAADVVGAFGPGLWALFGAAGLLLLIACINVANLLLARGATRHGEVAVRAALGAGRGRLVSQFLVESVLLGALGTLAGLAVAVLAVRGFLAWSPVPVPRADEVAVRLPVLGFTAGLGAVVTMLFGLAPALVASRADLQGVLRSRIRGGAGSDAGRRALVVAEVALAVVLLAGAGLLVRTVGELLGEDTGVEAGSAITMDIQLAGDAYAEWAAAGDFYHRLVENLRARPDVRRVGAGNFLPLQVGWNVYVTLPDRPPPAEADRPRPQFHTVDGGWFDVLGVPLRAGRTFDDRDGAEGQPVVVVNRTLAERYWPGAEAVGKVLVVRERGIGPLGSRVAVGDEHVVVGVAEDIRNVDVRSATEPAVFFPPRQFPFLQMHLVIDGPGDRAALANAVREEVRRLAPALPLGEVRGLAEVLAAPAGPSRLIMLLMGVFAALALTLAAVGIYGILAYAVTRRRREMAVRMALGARPGAILGLIVRQGMALAVGGVLLGVAVAAAGGRVLASLLYGVTPTDPVNLAAVAGVVTVAALAACALPALRAARLRPGTTLRSE